MKYGISLLLFFASAAQGKMPIIDLLNGCWRTDLGKTSIDERWDSTNGGLMMGTSKTINGGVAIDWEFLTIRSNRYGTVYQPYSKGVKMAAFPMDERMSNANRLVFRNPTNDFPKEIRYEKKGDKLEVTLWGKASKDTVMVYEPIECID